MADSRDRVPAVSSDADIAAFVTRAAGMPATTGGRLLFALDATASREPTWDRACELQARMFEAAAAVGDLSIQLCHYRGQGEFRTSAWCTQPRTLLAEMRAVRCAAGATQIVRVLGHAARTARARRLDTVVLVADCVEEPTRQLAAGAGALGLLGVPVLVFQEGREASATRAFSEIARLSRGAHCHFDGTSARELGDLLRAAAVYAVGGRAALTDFGRRTGGAALRLSSRIDGDVDCTR